MKTRTWKLTDFVEYLIIGFIFIILFGLPVLFTRVNGEISWIHVFKIWKDQSLLIPVFIINHWIFAPKLMLRQKYLVYVISILSLVSVCSGSYYYYDNILSAKQKTDLTTTNSNKPTPIPPYAHLLMYALLISGVDTGLLFTKKWNENEESQQLLEKKNIEIQLKLLRNQVSPHFLMNTLNNIYALIDLDSPKAKEAVMKLSKLMRYMLYENENGKVLLTKEFEFVQSYIDIMKLRFDNDLFISLKLPENFDHQLTIPPMLFVSFIENAFKHGASYENNGKIGIAFSFDNNLLIFNCFNRKNKECNSTDNVGLGIENSKSRLNLIYGDLYELIINSVEKLYEITLKIPLK